MVSVKSEIEEQEAKRTLAEVAYHESGHAIVILCWGGGTGLAGGRVDSVSIVPGKYWHGVTRTRYRGDDPLDPLLWSGRLRERRRSAISSVRIDLAGLAAEEVHASARTVAIRCLYSDDSRDIWRYVFHHVRHGSFDEDLKKAVLHTLAAYPKRDHVSHLRREYELVLRYLRHYRAPLDRLAASLLENTTLNRHGIKKAIGGGLIDLEKWMIRGHTRHDRRLFRAAREEARCRSIAEAARAESGR